VGGCCAPCGDNWFRWGTSVVLDCVRWRIVTFIFCAIQIHLLTYLLIYLKCGLGRGLPPYQVAFWSIQPRLATTDMGRKLGAAVRLFLGGGAGSPSNKMWTGPRPTYEVASMQSFGHYRHGPRLIRTKATTASINFESGAAVPLSVGSWYPCNTMWPEPRPTSIPSGIIIHPSIQPFGHNTSTLQTDRQRRTAIA